MNALGRGLASLIPKRDKESAEDLIERIDSMEVVEEEAGAVQPADGSTDAPTTRKVKVGVVEEVEDLPAADEEKVAPPPKPLVTPLTIDPDDSEEIASSAKAKMARTVPADQDPTKPEFWDRHEEQVIQVPIGDIKLNPHQPRRSFDPTEMAELTSSIAQHGILQPLVVRRLEDGSYELIAGERRLRAAKGLNWDKVPVVVRKNVDTSQSQLVLSLIENIQRQNLNPVEEATAYKQLNEEYGLTHEEIGKRVGRSRVGITNIVRVLQLPAEIQRGLSEGIIQYGHARAILMIPDVEKQLRFYRHLVEEGLTVRKAELRARRIQRLMKVHDPLRTKKRGRHALALKYAPLLEERYGYDANVRFDGAKNRFDVIFKAHSEKELDELVGRLMGTVPLPQNMDEDIISDINRGKD